jgi:hypothetical protein
VPPDNRVCKERPDLPELMDPLELQALRVCRVLPEQQGIQGLRAIRE